LTSPPRDEDGFLWFANHPCNTHCCSQKISEINTSDLGQLMKRADFSLNLFEYDQTKSIYLREASMEKG
jgi:hypothetical protein